MKLRKMLLAAALCLAGTAATWAQAQQMPQLPTDPDVRIGKLDNGLTYYIRHNNWPEQRAEFYIAQRVGSIQEDDDQRGLAHFLEHMAFNGSKHFQGNDLLRWCESVGVKFGTDLNAYTSIDQTVYNISNVPTTRETIVDSCLLILYDWADGLLLEQEEIEKERGVIHEEWRLRTSAQMRMLERDLPRLYPGSKYGHRMPIGLMEIIDNFERPFLQAYYEKWYRPDNQGIIVVGDVDVDQVEQKIKTLFSQIETPAADAPKVVMEPVPDNSEPIVVIDQDKEQPYTLAEVMWKHEGIPDELKNTPVYLTFNYMKNAVVAMLSDRLKEAGEKADCPYLQAFTDDDDYLLSRSVQAFGLSVVPKEGQLEASVKAAMTEAIRAAKFGFTQTEYNRYVANWNSNIDKQYSNKEKRFNRQFVNQYVRHFLSGEPIPSIDDYYAMMKQIVPVIQLEQINNLAQNLIQLGDSNLVVLCFNQEKEGAVYPTEQGVLKAIGEARQQQVEAYVDNVKDEPIIATLPKPGKIKQEEQSDVYGYTTLTLSNGVKVILKKTDLKKDQVIMRGQGVGGSALYGAADFANIDLFDDAIEASGLGNFSHTELEKALAGKVASASLTLGEQFTSISGSSTPGDVETMLQLTYLYFTSIAKDQASFDQMLKTTEVQLKNRSLNPQVVFSDSLRVTMANHNPRFKPTTADDLKLVDYDRILQIAKERTSNAAAYTFTIVGNFDEATIRPLVERYLGSLPGKKKVKKGTDVSDQFKGHVVNSFKHKAETPTAIAMMYWYSKQMDYSLENVVLAQMAGQVLSMEYLKKIREDASAAYTVGASGNVSQDDFGTEASIYAYCPMKPEKADTALLIMRQEVTSLAQTCDADKLQKVKEYLLKSHSDRTKENNYWVNCITTWRRFALDVDTEFDQVVQAQTPETVSAFVRELLKEGNMAEVIMLPADE